MRTETKVFCFILCTLSHRCWLVQQGGNTGKTPPASVVECTACCNGRMAVPQQTLSSLYKSFILQFCIRSLTKIVLSGLEMLNLKSGSYYHFLTFFIFTVTIRIIAKRQYAAKYFRPNFLLP